MSNKKGMPPKGPKPTMNFSVIKRLLQLLFKDYPVQICIIFACVVLNAIIGVSPAIFIERITALILTGLESSWEVIRPDVMQSIALMLCIFAVGICCSYLQARLVAIVTQGFLDKMRKRMFNNMQTLPVKFFDTTNHGDIMSYYTNDTDTLRQLISQGMPSIFSAVITIVFLLFVMLYYSVSLMTVVFVGVFAMLNVTKKVGGNSAKFFMRQQKSMGETEGFVEEMMNGQKVIKVFCHEEEVKKDFDKVNEKLFKDAESANRFANIFGPIMGNIGNILYVLTAFVGGLIIASNGKVPNISIENIVTYGSLAAPLGLSVVASYLGMTKQFTGSVNQASQQINSIAMAMAGASRIFEFLDICAEVDDGYVTIVNCRIENGEIVECEDRTGMWAWKHPHLADGSVTYTQIKGDIVLDDVDFAYEEGKTVLHNVSLYAKPGQKVAFVGATGAGKTTITNLINRFYDIADGKIRYDGININKIKKSDLRKSLGVILQDTNLFTGTVMDNIRYGKLDATDEECIKAAKLANAHGFITRLPEGYNTQLTSNGANLSQGQRQLLSIARAAVADPPVMIMDEATSSIDTRTELLVQRGMDALMEGRTVFVIAHRLSTVRNSDAIMVLDHGRIIERGSHDDLIAQKGTYYSLYTGAFELE